MGEGIDAARPEAPEHTKLLDNMKDQLLLVLILRLGGTVSIPVAEIDGTSGYVGTMSVTGGGIFNFKVIKKH